MWEVNFHGGQNNFLQLGIFFLIVFLKEVFSNRDVLGVEVGSSWSADPLESWCWHPDMVFWSENDRHTLQLRCHYLISTNRHQKYSIYIFDLALNMLPFSHAAIIFVLRSMRLQEMDIVTMGVWKFWLWGSFSSSCGVWRIWGGRRWLWVGRGAGGWNIFQPTLSYLLFKIVDFMLGMRAVSWDCIIYS